MVLVEQPLALRSLVNMLDTFTQSTKEPHLAPHCLQGPKKDQRALKL